MTPETLPSVSFLLLSGGVGERSGHHEPKQFYELHGHPMIAHSIIPAVREPRIGEIITNAPAGFEDRMHEVMQAYCGGKPYKVLPTGSTRQESCHKLVQSAVYETVLLHEAARPFVDLKTYQQLLDAPEPNAGYCYPISFSMCRIDPKTKQIKKGVSRDKVFDIQLPQKFERDTLNRAHQVALEKGKAFNEDAVMVVKMVDEPVLSLVGSSRNRKITTPEDFIIAEQVFLRSKK